MAHQIDESTPEFRRAKFNDSLVLVKSPKRYEPRTMLKLQERLSKYFGADTYVVCVRVCILHENGFCYKNSLMPKISSVYLATFESSKVWKAFWEICKKFSHGTKCAPLSVNGSRLLFDNDDKNSTDVESAFKDLHVGRAVRALYAQFGNAISELPFGLIPQLD